MAGTDPSLSTGLSGLDGMLTGLVPGDNIVWKVSSIEDYLPFVEPYCREAFRRGRKLTYFRFAKHAALVSALPGIEVCELRPEEGFEAFVSEIHHAVDRTGRGGYCLFDVLSDLAVDWYSDQMLGNFFVLTCPHILEVGALAYFGLLHGHHSREATGPILDTAQVVLDVHRHQGTLYVQASKVEGRHSATMYWLHERDGDEMRPVSDSATVSSEVLSSWRIPGRAWRVRQRLRASWIAPSGKPKNCPLRPGLGERAPRPPASSCAGFFEPASRATIGSSISSSGTSSSTTCLPSGGG